ncbi:MAG TPA: isoprenyl synthetase [Prolixibacteraceae bacterium]|nr:isoprenyl synthetase [Prolixibacteraceae bacterium]
MKTLEQLIEMIDSAVKENNQVWASQMPVNLYRPVSYSMSAGGKRLRPLMVLLGYQFFDDAIERSIPVAMAIEVFHNFTLLHDDIMDQADVRRGLPTVHKKFSANAAILSGDAMSFLAYGFLLECTSERLPQILKLFTRTALEVCEGQQYDMDFESRMDVTADEYIMMIRLKTAVLLGCALKAGALAGGADEVDADKLYEIGIRLGIAFQLQDDLLDTFGNENEFGKKIGGDIVANKKTYLLIKALEKAYEPEKSDLMDWLLVEQFNVTEKIVAVKTIFENLNVRTITIDLIQSHLDGALSLLSELPAAPERKALLEGLINKLVDRNH